MRYKAAIWILAILLTLYMAVAYAPTDPQDVRIIFNHVDVSTSNPQDLRIIFNPSAAEAGPTVTHNSPADGVSFSNNTVSVTLNWSVQHPLSYESNCTMIVNGVVQNVTQNVINETVAHVFSVMSNQSYNWSANCTDINGTVGLSGERTFDTQNFTSTLSLSLTSPVKNSIISSTININISTNSTDVTQCLFNNGLPEGLLFTALGFGDTHHSEFGHAGSTNATNRILNGTTVGNAAGAQVTFILGDSIDDVTGNYAQHYDNQVAVQSLLDTAGNLTALTLGNHDWTQDVDATKTKAEVLQPWNNSYHNYSNNETFDWYSVPFPDGILFISVSCLYDDEYEFGLESGVPAYCPLEMQEWLNESLFNASRDGLMSLVIGHYRFDDDAVYGTANNSEMRAIFESYNETLLGVLTGHDHTGGTTFLNGVRYVNFAGWNAGGSPDTTYGLIRVYNDSWNITGTGDQSSYNFSIPSVILDNREANYGSSMTVNNSHKFANQTLTNASLVTGQNNFSVNCTDTFGIVQNISFSYWFNVTGLPSTLTGGLADEGFTPRGNLTLMEGEEFHAFANWTNLTGSPIGSGGGWCNWSADNITQEVTNATLGTNETICTGACDFSTRTKTMYGLDTVAFIEDEFKIRVCREGVAGARTFTISNDCGFSAVHDFSEIVLCDSGYTNISNFDGNCSGVSVINMSLTSDAVAPPSALRLVDSYFYVDRRHNMSENMTWNATAELWYSTHAHESYDIGAALTINMSCQNDTEEIEDQNYSFIVAVENIPPIISFSDIWWWLLDAPVAFSDDAPFVAKYPLESTLNITGVSSDENLDFCEFNLTNITGGVIDSYNITEGDGDGSQQTNYTQGNFSVNQLYNHSIWCNDTFGSSVVITRQFNVSNLQPTPAGGGGNVSIDQNDDLTCNFTYIDPEGESGNATITLYLNGVSYLDYNESGVANNSVVSNSFSDGWVGGDNLTCEFNMTDSFFEVYATNYSILVNTTVPNIQNETITPDPLTAGSNAVCNGTYVSPDNVTGNVSFDWFVNGSLVYNETRTLLPNGTSANSTLQTGNFSANATIICQLTPSDNVSEGEAVNVSATVLTGTPCTISLVDPCDGCRYQDNLINATVSCSNSVNMSVVKYSINNFANNTVYNGVATDEVNFTINAEKGWNRYTAWVVGNGVEVNATRNYWAKDYDADSFADYAVLVFVLLIVVTLIGVGMLTRVRVLIAGGGFGMFVVAYELMMFSMVSAAFTVVAGIGVVLWSMFGK